MNNQSKHWDEMAKHPPDASVIDPKDNLGHKNRYIYLLRNHEILRALNDVDTDDPILDFGCGTGGLSAAIASTGRSIIAVDISRGLLERTSERNLDEKVLFVQYDGTTLPLQECCASGAVTWVVLTHIMDDNTLLRSLKEIHRVLKPGAKLIAIEQVRSKRTLDLEVWQCRRTIDEYKGIFEKANFEISQSTIIRYGRFPLILAIRLGWIFEAAYPLLYRLERWIGRSIGTVRWDYCDVLFSLTKHEN